MALASQSELLDELMGKNRNSCGVEGRRRPHWSDEHLCKYFLCGFCPHDLFVNTKPDLGPCDKIHNERFRDNYEKSDRFQKMGYEEDFYRYLCYLLEDVDKRIRRGHERLTVNRAIQNNDPEYVNEKHEKIESLTRKINELIEQAEKLGTEGNVDQAQGVLKLCEQLRMDRSQLDGDSRPGAGQSKELEVCEICGAFRIKEDAPQRVEEHLTGKMHLGYAKIRDYIREHKEKRTHFSIEKERDESRRSEREHSDRRHNRDGKVLRNSSTSRHRGQHGSSPNNRSHRTRSRSPSRKHAERHSHHSDRNSRMSKRDVSPFSAARRAPEGAEND